MANPPTIDQIGGIDTVVSSLPDDNKVTGTTALGSSVTLFFNGSPLGTAQVEVSGSWSYFLTGDNITTLRQGVSESITATATDAGGTSAPTTSALFSIESLRPFIGITQPIAGDNIINASEAANVAGVVISGATVANSAQTVGRTVTVTLKDNASATVDALTAVVKADSTWSATVTTVQAQALTDGSYTVHANVFDAAGNPSNDDATQTLTVDETAPAATSTPDLLAASDSGTSNADDITNVVLPTITGTGEVGATVTLLDGATTIGTGTVAADGGWSITATTALTEGANTITATQTDAAGNTSGPSAALGVTLDTTAAAPTALALSPASDSGAQGDDITNVALPTITGTGEAGATVTLRDGATTIGTGAVAAGGGWSVAATTALAEGANSITATQTDVAGNISGASAALNVTLDTTAPAATSTPDLLAASDSGTSNADDITNVVLPTITGTGEVGATVTLLDGATTIGTGTVAADGGGYRHHGADEGEHGGMAGCSRRHGADTRTQAASETQDRREPATPLAPPPRWSVTLDAGHYRAPGAARGRQTGATPARTAPELGQLADNIDGCRSCLTSSPLHRRRSAGVHGTLRGKRRRDHGTGTVAAMVGGPDGKEVVSATNGMTARPRGEEGIAR